MVGLEDGSLNAMSPGETALHEAGHAVAHVRLDIQQTGVSIKPVPEQGRLGAVNAEGIENVWDSEGAQAQVLAYCAGYAALIAVGLEEARAVEGADDDFDSAVELIESWGLDGTIEIWKQRAVSMMQEPRNLLAVRTVAERLERDGSLDDQWIDMLVDLADGEISSKEFERFVAFRAHMECRSRTV